MLLLSEEQRRAALSRPALPAALKHPAAAILADRYMRDRQV